jgi:hypothetical protein
MTRVLIPLFIAALAIVSPRPALGHDYGASDDEQLDYIDQEQASHNDLSELRKEKYKTALARERAEQAYHADRARHYESQARVRETYSRRAEEERDYDQRSDQINTVNQATTAITSIVRQIQVLSGHGY